jgi:hypothetical protein
MSFVDDIKRIIHEVEFTAEENEALLKVTFKI